MNVSQEQFQKFICEEAGSIMDNLESPVLNRNYWKKPSLDEVMNGDDSIDLIFHAIGSALTQWEVLENNLFSMYMMFCELESASSYNAIRRSFGTIESSAARRIAIIEAAKIYFGEEEYSRGSAKQFKKIFEAHEAATKRRNDIAHGVAHGFTINNESKGFFLFPASYNSGRNTTFMVSDGSANAPYLTETYRYTSSNIYSFTKKFGELSNLSMNFLNAAVKINGTPKIIIADMLKKNS